MFLHKIPTVLHFTLEGRWGIAPTGVPCCSAALPRCNRLHLQGIERVFMHLLEGNGDEMTILMIQTRMLVFVNVKYTFSLVQLTVKQMHNSKKNVQLGNKFIAILMQRLGTCGIFFVGNHNTSLIFSCLH
jgi:hypothetical protein